ncbi:hypothetical protein FBY23_1369 [Nocardioides sp. SLBN-35]|nr:hypothetical protein FBY23_1369 [Nocardioides sp. SLBN-35]
MENRPRDPRHRAHVSKGQVSEVGNLDDAGEVEAPSDSVAGHPTDRAVQEGRTGPNARTGSQDEEDRR